MYGVTYKGGITYQLPEKLKEAAASYIRVDFAKRYDTNSEKSVSASRKNCASSSVLNTRSLVIALAFIIRQAFLASMMVFHI